MRGGRRSRGRQHRSGPIAAPRLLLLVLIALLWPAPPLAAHEGQPFPLLEDAEAGPYRLDLWGDPDFGDAEFWIVVDEGGQPGALSVAIAAFPEADPAHRIERRADWMPTRGRPEEARFGVVGLPLDRDGWWLVSVSVEGPDGRGEARARVELRSLGPSGRAALGYTIPFAFLAALALAEGLRRRRARGTLAAGRALSTL